MVADTTTWHKPPFARHASIYEALADVLEGATPSAVKLALYLYRTCIGGKPEEIDIYGIPLGEKRATRVRNGKPYSPNTRRTALGQLEKLGLVKILKSYGRGIFRIAVQHLGDVRPFTHTNSKFQKLTDKSKNQSRKSKIEQTGGSNPDGAVLSTKDKKGQQSTEKAAAFLNILKESESLTSSKNLTPSDEKPQLVSEVKTSNTELNKNSQEQLKIPIENKCSAQTAESLKTDSYDWPAIDATIPYTSEQIDLTPETTQKHSSKQEESDNQTISTTESAIPINKTEFPAIANYKTTEITEVPAISNPEAIEIIATPALANYKTTEIAEVPAIADSEAIEIVETPAIADFEAIEIVETPAIINSTREIAEAPITANYKATEITESPAIFNSDAIELVKTHAIANPQATEIIAAVKQATGGMNRELKIYVLQYSPNEIQAAINLLQTRSQTKQISNPSGWIVDCLRGRWWEKTNSFNNSNPTNAVSSSTPIAPSPTPTNSSPTQTARITESYIDPQYMPLETHQEFCKQFETLGKEAFEKLGVQQQIYSQWMHRFPQQLKSILVKLSKTT